MNIYSVAKTIMIADRIYEDLKKAKGADRSFSEVIAEALEASKVGRKTGAGLKDIVGILKGDTEYDEVKKYLKKKWKEWDRRYA
ncbi:antitoxin VapB family protein [Candidatus Woesearchaeota archaeon]|nr:antitoxin VapB family protein [Candidatus Woesearchaeota archaeon]